ncbi:hypothetical protein [Anaerocolumna chitinilytica]|uniref:hypothetical protein n=1 Tax=Anaerocolumna chitinilytica TaxID=1727145 RepID=UPI001629FC0E|nr:hypothetical protein [Anaerocolumna chitinilytica]
MESAAICVLINNIYSSIPRLTLVYSTAMATTNLSQTEDRWGYSEGWSRKVPYDT